MMDDNMDRNLYVSRQTGALMVSADMPAAIDAQLGRESITPHAIRFERRRGFQPPWYRVTTYTCADGTETILRRNWRGPTPRGAIIGNCGHQLTI